MKTFTCSDPLYICGHSQKPDKTLKVSQYCSLEILHPDPEVLVWLPVYPQNIRDPEK